MFEDASVRSHPGCAGRENPELFGQILRRRLRGAAGDEGAGAAIGAGIVATMRGVGLLEVDLIDGGCQRGGGDLAVYRGGAVAELGSADRQFKSAILTQRNAGIGEM